MRVLILLTFLFVSACEPTYEGETMMLEEAVADFEEIFEVPATMQIPAPAEPMEEKEFVQKFIKNGGLTFQSESIEKDYQIIRDLLPKYQAYIENENQYKSTERISYQLTIRVPSTVYDTLYTKLASVAFRLDNRYSNIEDVTERYYDLKTRIKNKTELEQRYLQLLSKATKIKDMLEIERNINNIRTEIERLQGQFNYLSKQVSFNTIELSFYEVQPYVYNKTERKGFGARLLSALDSGWQGFLSFLVGIISLWPFVFVLVGAVYLVRKIRARWKRK